LARDFSSPKGITHVQASLIVSLSPDINSDARMTAPRRENHNQQQFKAMLSKKTGVSLQNEHDISRGRVLLNDWITGRGSLTAKTASAQ
jgi:hypothetical protein